MGGQVKENNSRPDPVSFALCDQQLWLFPERAIFWVAAKTLVVADVHMGKSATFRSYGIPLPAGTTQDNLTRMTQLLRRTKAERLIILGDLLHARAGRSAELISQVNDWRQKFPGLAMHLVMGNHDRQAGQPPASWGIQCDDELVEPPFVWRHEPGETDAGYVLAGHLHPAVRLRGKGEQLRLPCFIFGETCGLLPAFGDFTGFSAIWPQKDDVVFVVADDAVIRFNA